MSITTTTTRITHRWLERKTKRELASIIMANIDRIDIFAEESKTLRAVLSSLVSRLYAVHDDGRYAAVWMSYMIHEGNYTGPKYDKELEAARAVLEK